jgi:hypothetical protein
VKVLEAAVAGSEPEHPVTYVENALTLIVDEATGRVELGFRQDPRSGLKSLNEKVKPPPEPKGGWSEGTVLVGGRPVVPSRFAAAKRLTRVGPPSCPVAPRTAARGTSRERRSRRTRRATSSSRDGPSDPGEGDGEGEPPPESNPELDKPPSASPRASDAGLAALELAANGWLVVPLHAPTEDGCSCGDAACARIGKHPRVGAWKSRATSDPATIRRWWDGWPDANTGILTGRRSGVVVLDVDPRNGGDDALAELERDHGPLPRTVSVVTGGGGQHYYFRAPSIFVAGRRIAQGLDLQAENNLLVAPPSRHASGRRYEWDNPPDETPLAEMPEWLLKRAMPRRSRRSRRRSITTIPKGSRNKTLTSIAGAMRLTMAYSEGIEAALQAINQARCCPPLPKAEVAGIARSAQRWHALPWLTSPRVFFFDKRLGVSTRAVLRAICDHADYDGVAWPSYAAIMRLTGIGSRTTVSRSIALLVKAGRISVERGVKPSNVYRINRALPAPAQVDPPVVLRVQNLEHHAERSVAL